MKMYVSCKSDQFLKVHKYFYYKSRLSPIKASSGLNKYNESVTFYVFKLTMPQCVKKCSSNKIIYKNINIQIVYCIKKKIVFVFTFI